MTLDKPKIVQKGELYDIYVQNSNKLIFQSFLGLTREQLFQLLEEIQKALM